MFTAVWEKILRDLRWHLLASALLLFTFAWLFVWLNSLVQIDLWAALLDMLPNFVHKLMPIPVKQLVTPTGRLSLIFVHIVPMVVFLGWAVLRSTEMVSGEIESGRFEVLLTLPIPRWVWVAVPGFAILFGSLFLAFVLWLGMAVGCFAVSFSQAPRPIQFSPAALNLAMMSFAFAGITAVMSASFQSRTKTVGLAVGFFLVSVMIKLIARLWSHGQWLEYLSFMTLFEPQQLIFHKEAGRLAVQYNLAFVGIGIAGFCLAAMILTRRDIAVPR